jgi:hypothetical protein
MDLSEGKDFKEKSFISEQRKEKIKEKVLDEDFKKATEFSKKSKHNTERVEKRPFFNLGFGLIFVGVLCLLILNFTPWIYVKYDSNITSEKDIDFFYYRDFEQVGTNQNQEFATFFQQGNSSKFLGISDNDLTVIPNVGYYIFIVFVLLGMLFTAINIFFIKKKNANIENLRVIHSFFAGIVAILSIYFIYVGVKFFGAMILLIYNNHVISNDVSNLFLAYLAPIILIFIVAGVLKLSFTIIKVNIREMQKITDEEKTKSSLKKFKQGVKLR